MHEDSVTQRLQVFRSSLDSIYETSVGRSREHATLDAVGRVNKILGQIAAEFPDLADDLPEPFQQSKSAFKDMGYSDFTYGDVASVAKQTLALVSPNKGAAKTLSNGPKIFVSHCSRDRQIVEPLANLLSTALHLKAGEEILCTSVEGYGLRGGQDLDSTLKTSAISAEAMVAVLTDASMTSSWVLFELGARWGHGNKNLMPVVLPSDGSVKELLPDQLKNTRALRLDLQDEVVDLVETLSDMLRLKMTRGASWQTLASDLVTAAKSLADSRRDETEAVLSEAARLEGGRLVEALDRRQMVLGTERKSLLEWLWSYRDRLASGVRNWRESGSDSESWKESEFLYESLGGALLCWELVETAPVPNSVYYTRSLSKSGRGLVRYLEESGDPNHPRPLAPSTK